MVGTTDVDFSISMLLPGLQLLKPVNVLILQVFTEQTDEQADGQNRLLYCTSCMHAWWLVNI